MVMAGEGDVRELNVHRAGYDRFVTLFRWSAATCFIVAMIVIFLIGN
jgi:hypothetical protein